MPRLWTKQGMQPGCRLCWNQQGRGSRLPRALDLRYLRNVLKTWLRQKLRRGMHLRHLQTRPGVNLNHGLDSPKHKAAFLNSRHAFGSSRNLAIVLGRPLTSVKEPTGAT